MNAFFFPPFILQLKRFLFFFFLDVRVRHRNCVTSEESQHFFFSFSANLVFSFLACSLSRLFYLSLHITILFGFDVRKLLLGKNDLQSEMGPENRNQIVSLLSSRYLFALSLSLVFAQSYFTIIDLGVPRVMSTGRFIIHSRTTWRIRFLWARDSSGLAA